MKLIVLTAAVFKTEDEAMRKLWVFRESCKKQDIHPYYYGIGRTFPGYRMMKLEWQLEWLKANKDKGTHVLYTDSWDAFFVRDLWQVQYKYDLMGQPNILTSAFYQLGNVSDEEKQYPGAFTHDTKYCYPNVGGYIAKIEAIIPMFERMLTLPRQTNDDCFNWYDAWAEGWFRPQLDSHCRIFQVGDEDVEVVGDRIHNKITDSFPCVWHLSGGYTDQETGKDRVLVPYAKKLGIIE